MRFGLYHGKKDNCGPSIHALEAFLNEHTIGSNHGATFEAIFVTFVENPSKRKKFKQRLLYGKYADIEIPSEFDDHRKLLLDDFERCFALVPTAIEKATQIPVPDMDFDHSSLLSDVKKAGKHMPRDQKALGQYHNNLPAIEKANHLKRVNCGLETRKNTPRPLTKRLVGVRVSNPEGLVPGPHAHVFSEIFGNLLRRSGLMLPGYREIYISLADTLDEAKSELALEDWHEYAYGALDSAKYRAASDEVKESMLLDSLSYALRTLADVDHLDTEIVESVIDRVRAEGAELQLTYMEKENKRYRAQVVYRPATPTRGGKFLYQLKIVDKETGREGLVDIGLLTSWWAPYSLGTLALGKKEIVIKARKSYRATVSLKADRLPSEYRFAIDDIDWHLPGEPVD